MCVCVVCEAAKWKYGSKMEVIDVTNFSLNPVIKVFPQLGIRFHSIVFRSPIRGLNDLTIHILHSNLQTTELHSVKKEQQKKHEILTNGTLYPLILLFTVIGKLDPRRSASIDLQCVYLVFSWISVSIWRQWFNLDRSEEIKFVCVCRQRIPTEPNSIYIFFFVVRSPVDGAYFRLLCRMRRTLFSFTG